MAKEERYRPLSELLGILNDDVLSIHVEITPDQGSSLKPLPCHCGCDKVMIVLQGCGDGDVRARAECPDCGMRLSGYSDTAPEARDAWNVFVSKAGQ